MQKKCTPMPYRARLIAAAACVLVAVLIACVSCSQKTKSGEVTIVITSNAFSPGSITVSEGTLVTWINTDTQPHTATAPGAFDSGPIGPNGRWTWVASLPGTFQYHSLIQPSMAGSITIVVNGPSGY